jgi:Dinucleotide-utilizing enzymes involved in molybdopterin and thiamine biosynthesis family 2
MIIVYPRGIPKPAAISKFPWQGFNFDFRKKTACFRCFMPETPNEEFNCDTDGVLTTLAGIAGSLQANEVIKSILGKKNRLDANIVIFKAIENNFRKGKLLKNPNCKNNHFQG